MAGWDEPAWQLAAPATDFVQWQPSTGELSQERTEVYILYDDENLYFGYVSYDSVPDRMTVNDLREDFTFSGTDSIGIVIDSLDDDRSRFPVWRQSGRREAGTPSFRTTVRSTMTGMAYGTSV